MKRLITFFLRRLARSLGVPELQERVDQFHYEVARIEMQQTALGDYVERRLDHLMEHIEVHARERGDAIQESLTAERQITETRIAELQKLIDRLRFSNSLPTKSTPPSSSNRQIDEVLYLALEDRFRGDPNEIRNRQAKYLPFVHECVTDSYPLLDIGFGRAEWLELLRDHNINARGIDINAVCVQEALSKGLRVEQADITSYLSKIPDHSLGAVTLFQVFEHLPFSILLDSLRMIVRALRPGGVLIAEIPNGETLSVGASTFWIDPTHERPLFPGVLTFLAKEVGFAHTEGVYSTPLEPVPDLSMIDEPARSAINALHHRVFGPGDFALIARA